MKSKPFAYLAASLLSAAIAAQAGSNTFGVLFCHARVVDSGTAELAVELPATPGYVDRDGNPVAVWKVGTVAAGGAIDTFYSENGPGAFQVRNTGNRNAFIYITTGDYGEMTSNTDSPVPGSGEKDSTYYGESFQGMFGEGEDFSAIPDPTKRENDPRSYSLAVSTEVTSRVPTWQNLCWIYDQNYHYGSNCSWNYCDTAGDGCFYFSDRYGSYDSNSSSGFGWRNATNDGGNVSRGLCGQYLGYLAAGEVQPFDLKFYAPYRGPFANCFFIVRLEASTFRRWEHDK